MGEGARALGHDVAEDLSIATASGVFPVGRLIGIVGQMAVAELVGLTDLHAPKPREVGFRLVVGRTVTGPVFTLMIDPSHREAGMQQVVGIRLISRDDSPRGDEACGQAAGIGLVLPRDHEAQGPAGNDEPLRDGLLGMVLTHDQDATFVRTLVLCQSSVNPRCLFVLRANMAVHISTVHLHLSVQRRFIALRHETFADLVHQYEGGLVLYPQIMADL